MYTIENPYYVNHVYDYDREITLEMYINDKLVDIKNILNKIQITFDSGMEEYTVGKLIYGKLTTTIHNDQYVGNDSVIKLILKLNVFNKKSNQWEWVSVPWGSYIVTEHTRKEMVTDIVAYSSLYSKLCGLFIPKSNSYTTRTIMTEMTNALGIPFDVSLIPNITLDNPDFTNEEGTVVEGTNFIGKTYGEMISLVAMVCSSNVIFTRDGNTIEFKSLTETNITLNEFRQPTTGNDIYEIKQVRMINANNVEFKGGNTDVASNNTLNLSNVFSNANIASSIYNSVKDIRYKTWGTTFMAPLHLDPLDVIKINYKDELHNIPMMYSKYTLANNVFVCEVQSNVVSSTNKSTEFKGTVTQRIENMYSDLVTAKEVLSDKVNTEQLDATNANVENLQANVAEIDNLLAGNITAENIQVGGITSDRLTIADGFITNAMVESLSANKIAAGTLDASAIEIVAQDVDGGELRIYDNTILINDGTRTRIQLGKDGEGDYNLYVWDKNGKILWDEDGITSNNVVRNDMISDDASIDASKINVDTLFGVINNEKTNTINSTQVKVDNERLNVTIGTLKTSQTNLESKTTSLETSLSVEQGKIATLVSESNVIKGDVTTLQDNYSKITQDVDSIELKVASVESTLGDKVNKDSIISSINLSTEGVAIQGNKVQLTGDTIVISNGVSQTLQEYLNTSKLTQEDIVDILNGSGDGLYLIDDKLLINAEYIQTGTLRADLVKVQLDDVPNLLPYNYITMKNAINTDGFYINEDDNGLPFADCELPIYGGGGGSEFFCKPFGYSNVKLEAGKHYWFSCEYYAVWNNDTKPNDGVGTSTALPSGGSKYGTGTGNNMDIFLSNGTYSDIETNSNFRLLASVQDFNASIQIVEREGVYQRGWTRLVGRIDCTENYEGNIWINIDGRGFEVGDNGWFYLRNLQLVDSSVADESIKLDYIEQVKNKRIELTDGAFYTGLYSVDGINLTEGVIEGQSSAERKKFTLDYDGYRLNATTGSDSAFIGEGKSKYTYLAGSSGILDGFNKLYGVGTVQTNENTMDDEGIFTGIHYGYQIKGNGAYGRPDIYVHNRYSESDGTSDWQDWSLLGEAIEPRGLVRRDTNNNITTNTCLYFDSGSAYINLSGTTYDLGAMLTSVATVSLDDEEVEVPALLQKVIELETKNAELEERIAKLEELLNK